MGEGYGEGKSRKPSPPGPSPEGEGESGIMKKIFAIAWKDAVIRFASSSELLFFIILPVVFTFLLAGGTPSGNEDNRIRLLVVDEANTPISKEIIRN